jgi:hypothetical protein
VQSRTAIRRHEAELNRAVRRNHRDAGAVFVADPKVPLIIHRETFGIQAIGIIRQHVIIQIHTNFGIRQAAIRQARDRLAIGLAKRDKLKNFGHSRGVQAQLHDSRSEARDREGLKRADVAVGTAISDRIE